MGRAFQSPSISITDEEMDHQSDPVEAVISTVTPAYNNTTSAHTSVNCGSAVTIVSAPPSATQSRILNDAILASVTLRADPSMIRLTPSKPTTYGISAASPNVIAPAVNVNGLESLIADISLNPQQQQTRARTSSAICQRVFLTLNTILTRVKQATFTIGTQYGQVLVFFPLQLLVLLTIAAVSVVSWSQLLIILMLSCCMAVYLLPPSLVANTWRSSVDKCRWWLMCLQTIHLPVHSSSTVKNGTQVPDPDMMDVDTDMNISAHSSVDRMEED